MCLPDGTFGPCDCGGASEDGAAASDGGGDATPTDAAAVPVDGNIAPDSDAAFDGESDATSDAKSDGGGGCDITFADAGPPVADAGSVVPGPSCAGGLSCQGLDCCASVVVPGGTFSMGRSTAGTDAYAAGGPEEVPEHCVTVSSFALDTFEVTVGRFREYVAAYAGPPAAGEGLHPNIPGTGWDPTWNARMPSAASALRTNLKCTAGQTWTDAPGPNEGKPINCVSWFEAFAFCAWDGGRLPTEAEWEYAATGGSENRLYPWGAAAPSLTHASYGCLFDGIAGCSPADLPPAGSTPAGNARWGHRDLAGSVWEWNLDWYAASWYSTGGFSCMDCTNTTISTSRVARGGTWGQPAAFLRAASRVQGPPTGRYDQTGVRCARTP